MQYLLPTEPYIAESGSWLTWMFSGELVRDAVGSMYRVLIGFLIGGGLALPIGILMGANQRIYDKMYILVQVLRPIPPSAYTPLAMLWFRKVSLFACSGLRVAGNRPCSMPWPVFPCLALASSRWTAKPLPALDRTVAWCSKNTHCSRG